MPNSLSLVDQQVKAGVDQVRHIRRRYRGVIIDTDDVRRAGVVAVPVGLVDLDSGAGKVIPQRVASVDPAAQQIPAEPAPFVEEVRQLRQLPRRVGLAQVVGLHQLGIQVDLPDRPHRQHYRAALVQQGLDEDAVIASVRIPDAGQAAEPRGRERLVDRRVVFNPGIACSHRAGEAGKLAGEGRIDQAGVARPAALVQQADDRRDAKFTQGRQAFVRPCPVRSGQAGASGALPQHGIAQRAHTKRSETLEVLHARRVAATIELAEVVVPHPVNCAFESTPQCDWRPCRNVLVVHDLILCRRELLAGFPADADRELESKLLRLDLFRKKVVGERGHAAIYVYFPCGGVLSVLAYMQSGAAVDVGTSDRVSLTCRRFAFRADRSHSVRQLSAENPFHNMN